MTRVTILILEGLERGQVYADLEPPLTLGREEDNTIQLNDERVSRFHAKIQEDGGRIILTDLQSTNGTRVNGRPVQMRVMQPGDLITIGRCVMIYGSLAEISERARLLESDPTVSLDNRPTEIAGADPESDDLSLSHSGISSETLDLFPNGPPAAPEGLQPFQQAQLSDLLAFVHDRICGVLTDARKESANDSGADEGLVQLDQSAWLKMVDLELKLAEYLKAIAEP